MIANSVALITGVSSGIGRRTAQLMAERGARVFGTVRDPSRINSIPKAEFVLMDVTDGTSVKNAVKSVLDEAGKIDILINNAGYSIAGALEETSVEEARLLFETNFFGVLRVTPCSAFFPALTAGCMSRASMRWRATPKRWITK